MIPRQVSGDIVRFKGLLRPNRPMNYKVQDSPKTTRPTTIAPSRTPNILDSSTSCRIGPILPNSVLPVGLQSNRTLHRKWKQTHRCRVFVSQGGRRGLSLSLLNALSLPPTSQRDSRAGWSVMSFEEVENGDDLAFL
eukprot:gb/GEZJ01009448.1/.p1 GENE.gb/GEZJ01009448.1/~~gb/GEZJ01009448.1/.p1  ORF type:complete len:137 (-),score=10.58 gb/GEZJ01009448.1/:77-487(-)